MPEGTVKFTLAERALFPPLMRAAEAVATWIGDSRPVERVMAALPDSVRIALDPVVAELGSIPEFTNNDMVDDIIRTFANKLGERLRVQTRGGARVTRADVHADMRDAYYAVMKQKEAAMAAVDELPVIVVEGETFFRMEGCPTRPAGGGKKGPAGPRVSRHKLEHAEKALGLLPHPGCEFCTKILAHEREKATKAAAALGEKLAAAARRPLVQSWIEHAATLPPAEREKLIAAVTQNLVHFFAEGEDRAKAEDLLTYWVSSVAEVQAFGNAHTREECDVILAGMRQRTPAAALKSAAHAVRDVFHGIADALRPAAVAPPAAPAAPAAPAPAQPGGFLGAVTRGRDAARAHRRRLFRG